jgi:hypothetical protein
MDSQRGQVREGRLERQGSGLRESARYEFETAPARRRLKARLFLCADVWDEKETNERKDGQRPGFSDQQEPTGLELLIWK